MEATAPTCWSQGQIDKAMGFMASALEGAASSCWCPLRLEDGDEQGGGAKRRRLSFPRSLTGKRRAANTATPQVGRRPLPVELATAAASDGALPLATLAGGPYLTIASYLTAADLCRADAACRLMHGQNSLPSGPWHFVGEREYFGMELDEHSNFVHFSQVRNLLPLPVGWKERCAFFSRHIPSFSRPFTGPEICNVENPDEVAYCRCRIRTDLLRLQPELGIYVEVDVRSNADNLSLAVVDFEGGGRSSVTFSPETGAVLRERKVREAPRAIEGTYIHLLSSAPAGKRFEGVMGLYLSGDGHLAFFRRWSQTTSNSRPPVWETTGLCTDLSWAQGPRLSLCLAFRDSGKYHVRISKVAREPPVIPRKREEAYQDDKWSMLYGDDEHPLAI